jgi:hypothetical protein
VVVESLVAKAGWVSQEFDGLNENKLAKSISI